MGPTSLSVSRVYAHYQVLALLPFDIYHYLVIRGSFLQVFLSAHYAGDDLVPKFGQGEAWKKVFGPVFVYVNSAMDGEDPLSLWDDAKRQVLLEQIVLNKHTPLQAFH